MNGINPKIVEYIKYYAGQGNSLDNIKTFLLANKISQKDIDDAIMEYNRTMVSSIPANNVTIEFQLKNYIQAQLNQGYNIEVIKSTLIRQGYGSDVVNRVANNLNNVNINVKHEVHISKGTIIGIAAIFIIGLVVFGIFNINMFKPKESLMDITVNPTDYSYLPGQDVNYQIHITNMGSVQRFDATIKSLIIDDAGNIITRNEVTLAVETTSSINRDIQLPLNIKPGKYSLKIIADYGSKQATSSSEIEIIKSVIDKKNLTYTPTTPKVNASPTYPSTIPRNPSTIPTTTNTGKVFGEVLSEVKKEAVNNPNSAADTCAKLTNSDQKDICFSTVAVSSEDKSYCGRITGSDYGDNCYLSFLMKNSDVSVCDNIINPDNKEFCRQLKIIQLMDVYYKEGNSDKMLELSKELNPDIYGKTPEMPNYDYSYTEPVTIMDIISEPAESTSDENSIGNTTIVETVNDTNDIAVETLPDNATV